MNNTTTPETTTADRALRCFEELALETGLDDVSMREVARRLGISLAALQYHYPTKSALVEAVVASVIETHHRRLDDTVAGADAADRFAEALRYIVIANAEDAESGGLMSMIWARAAHDAFAGASLQQFMQAYVERMTDIVAAEFSELTPDGARTAASLVISLLEGLEDVRPAAVAEGADPAELTASAVSVAAALPDLVARHG